MKSKVYESQHKRLIDHKNPKYLFYSDIMVFTLKPSDLSCWAVTKNSTLKKEKKCEENQILGINAFTII